MDHKATKYIPAEPSANQGGIMHPSRSVQQTIEKVLSTAVRLFELVLQPKVLIVLIVSVLGGMGYIGKVAFDKGRFEIDWESTSWVIRNVKARVNQTIDKGTAKVCHQSDGIDMYGRVLWLHNQIGEDDYMAGPILPTGRVSCVNGDQLVQIGSEDAQSLHSSNDASSFRILEEVRIYSIPPGYELDHRDMSLRRFVL